MRAVPSRLGSFELIALLGVGGMAEVYLGRSPGPLSKLVAIKLLRDHLADDPVHVKMFLDEARLGGLLDHPNTVPAYQIGREGDRWFLVMNYVAGETLATILRRARMPIEVALVAIIDAAEGLHALHELRDSNGSPLGAVHRDVSPMNMIVGHDGMLRVIDFGICKSGGERREHTSPGVQKGKFAYMAPEQINVQPVDHRTDVFALGVVLVGLRLFKADDLAATIDRILTMRIPRASSLRRDCPQAIDEILTRALSRDRTRRFPTAKDFGRAVEAVLLEIAPGATHATVERFMHETFPAGCDPRAPSPPLVDPLCEVTVRMESQHRIAV